MKYRIAIGGIHIESSTFTPYISSKKDFIFKRGQCLLESYTWLEDYNLEVEVVPLIHARALPGGVVSREFYNEWREEFVFLLNKVTSENKIDGVLLDIHGAMSIEGMMDAEGVIAEDIRAIVGDNVIISSTMDLHGNVSDKLFNSADLLTCYRTAPHIDTFETRKRAFENMLRVIKFDGDKLVRAKVDIPILLSGEKTSTEVEPGKSLYAAIDEICSKDEIIDASIWMGFPWADQPRSHAAVVVLGTDSIIVKHETEKLAKKFWDLRNEFNFVGPVANIDEAISIALSSEKKPFFISDTGDNPGAGGSGDMNLLLKGFLKIDGLVKMDKKILIASIFDPESIELLYRSSIGRIISLSLGGKVDLSFGGPAEIDIKIDYFFRDDIAGRCAVVSLKNISIIITEKRYQYGKLESYYRAGIKAFSDFDIIIVKMGYLEPDLSNAAKGWVMALTPGAVSQDLNNINYKNLKRPLFPLDSDIIDVDLRAKLIIRE